MYTITTVQVKVLWKRTKHQQPILMTVICASWEQYQKSYRISIENTAARLLIEMKLIFISKRSLHSKQGIWIEFVCQPRIAIFGVGLRFMLHDLLWYYKYNVYRIILFFMVNGYRCKSFWTKIQTCRWCIWYGFRSELHKLCSILESSLVQMPELWNGNGNGNGNRNENGNGNGNW